MKRALLIAVLASVPIGLPVYLYATEPVCLPRPTLAVLCIAYPRWRTWL